jgi:hypothetical protein
MVAVNSKVFLFSCSTHSLHVSARADHLQVNINVSCEASYCPSTDPLFRLSSHILSLVIKVNLQNLLNKISVSVL